MKLKSILFSLLVMMTVAGSSCNKEDICPEQAQNVRPTPRPDEVKPPVKVTNPQP